MTSVASLPFETEQSPPINFKLNTPIINNVSEIPPMFNVKHQSNFFNRINETNMSASIDLENFNPPSLFNEVTDLCNSLADVATDTICSQTEVFEDCPTHFQVQTEDEITEYSDVYSLTPIQSDVASSAESTPKKSKRTITPKEKRSMAKDRYKTYTISPEMVNNILISYSNDFFNLIKSNKTSSWIALDYQVEKTFMHILLNLFIYLLNFFINSINSFTVGKT